MRFAYRAARRVLARLAARDSHVLAGGEHLLRQAVAREHAARRQLAMPNRLLAVGARDAQIDERMRIDELKLGDGAVDRDLLAVVVMRRDAVVSEGGQRQQALRVPRRDSVAVFTRLSGRARLMRSL